ncbi:MAG: hypothetical protein ACK5NI_00920 [bacterium]|jgi:hypothetical protein
MKKSLKIKMRKCLKEKRDRMKNTQEIMNTLEIGKILKKKGLILNREIKDIHQEKIKIEKGIILRKVEVTKFKNQEIIKKMIKNIIQKKIIKMIMTA